MNDKYEDEFDPRDQRVCVALPKPVLEWLAAEVNKMLATGVMGAGHIRRYPGSDDYNPRIFVR